MRNTSLRNTWLVIKREYLERVRQRSFIVLTLLLPAIMIGAFAIPAKLSSMKNTKMQRLVVVTSTPQFGEIVRQQLVAGSKPDHESAAANKDKDKDAEDEDNPGRDYAIEVDSSATEAERTALRDRVNSGDIDGFLWLTDDAVAARKVTYYGRQSGGGGFMENSWLKDQLDRAILLQELAQRGVSGAQVEQLLKPVKLETMRLEGGRETKANDKGMFFAVFAMVMLLYTAVIFYGVSVMRAVLEEKNSRVMEVLLSSATSTELMAGKLIGVGAVGLTQIAIWIAMAATYALPALAASASTGEIHIAPLTLAAFALFFLLGYLLFSSIYAAIGAVITSEQEGQQMQFIIILPLIISVFMMGPVMHAPDSPVAVWTSMVPFFSPVLMYLRIAVQPPPVWQIALSLALLVGTIAGILVLCARIYRIGILMYGKRPTLPEILKWLKYA
ncbi:MAG: ABC transporter permease [Candidatus Sulfotelmatobacter sp.]|jgi:ABC-2 type transport system permease protein